MEAAPRARKARLKAGPPKAKSPWETLGPLQRAWIRELIPVIELEKSRCELEQRYLKSCRQALLQLPSGRAAAVITRIALRDCWRGSRSSTTDCIIPAVREAQLCERLGYEITHECGRLDPKRKMHLVVRLLNLLTETVTIPKTEVLALKRFVKRERQGGKWRSNSYIGFTEQAEDWIRRRARVHEFLEPEERPATAPPPPTTNLIKDEGHNDADISHAPRVLLAVQALNATPWRINRWMLGVIGRVWKEGGGIGQMPRTDSPANDPGRVLFERTLKTAQTLATWPRFYYGNQLDFRGRIYPVLPHLNHLQGDVSRAVMEFAEGRPAGDDTARRWLKIHLANCCGENRDSAGAPRDFDARVAWVDNNAQVFQRWVRNAARRRKWRADEWAQAGFRGDPFQALAAARALADDAAGAHVPVQLDASISVLQHLAALTCDEDLARQVNLTASDKPADFYREVEQRIRNRYFEAQTSIASVLLDWKVHKDTTGQRLGRRVFREKAYIVHRSWLNRGFVKSIIMPQFYGQSAYAAKRRIRDLVGRDKWWGLKQEERTGYRWLVQTIRNASFTAAHLEMENIQGWARAVAKAGHDVSWTTPLGMVVRQRYRRGDRIRIQTTRQKITLRDWREEQPQDSGRHARAVCANYIHSLDAAHMMLTALACADKSVCLAGVHDCYWTHAADVPLLNKLVRRMFAEMHAEPLLAFLRRDMRTGPGGGRYPPIALLHPSAKRKYKAQEVLEAPYFIS